MFTGATLTDAVFARTNLTTADLTGADLTNAILTGANLTKTNFTNVSFGSANLSGATLDGTTITEAKLAGTNLLNMKVAGPVLGNPADGMPDSGNHPRFMLWNLVLLGGGATYHGARFIGSGAVGSDVDGAGGGRRRSFSGQGVGDPGAWGIHDSICGKRLETEWAGRAGGRFTGTGRLRVLPPTRGGSGSSGAVGVGLDEGLVLGERTTELVLDRLDERDVALVEPAPRAAGPWTVLRLATPTLTVAGMARIVQEGELYFNLHTTSQTYFGDIRGQIHAAEKSR